MKDRHLRAIPTIFCVGELDNRKGARDQMITIYARAHLNLLLLMKDRRLRAIRTMFCVPEGVNL